MKLYRTSTNAFITGLASLLLFMIIGSGCADYKARKNLEAVAKGWCRTIRASQVVPVYPLTQDLMVGDVFLVQTPISQLAKDYERAGFLPLDDAQVRLPLITFKKVYFDGYWKDEYGSTPHPVTLFTNAGSFTNAADFKGILTDAPLPRAAFPTYSFQAKSGFGFNAAFPIQGIPVALSYLNSQEVNGSVTIADARTYAGDTGELLELLQKWFFDPANHERLLQTASNAAPKRIFLRVVTRVYYARAIDVSLQRSDSQGASGKGGNIGDVSLLTTNGGVGVNPDYTNVLNTLSSLASAAASTVSNMTQVGAAVKFVSASKSTVGLSQVFDRLLAIGYLGFDVEIGLNGYLGPPIPTFQHQSGKIPTPQARPRRLGMQGMSVLPDILFSVQTILGRFADHGDKKAQELLEKLDELEGLDLPDAIRNDLYPIYFFDGGNLTLTKNKEASVSLNQKKLNDINVFITYEEASREHLVNALKQLGEGKAVKLQEGGNAPVSITPAVRSGLESDLARTTSRLEKVKKHLRYNQIVIAAYNYVESRIAPQQPR